MIRHILEVLEDFIRAYFDKLLMTALFVFLTGVVIQFDQTPTSTWAQQAAGTILGALVMLITGRGIAKTNGNGNGNGKPPEEPTK